MSKPSNVKERQSPVPSMPLPLHDSEALVFPVTPSVTALAGSNKLEGQSWDGCVMRQEGDARGYAVKVRQQPPAMGVTSVPPMSSRRFTKH